MVYNIQPASFRGVPFAVDGTSGANGRKVAVHAYPFRDSPWVEDLGRANREGTLEGFLLAQDIDSTRQALLDACETSGPGTLVHPTRGSISITLTAPLKWREDRDRLGRCGFVLEYVEESDQLFPWVGTDSISGIATAGGLASSASQNGFLSSLQSGAADIKSTIATVKMTVQPYVNLANSVVGDARSIAGSVTGLGGIASSLTGGRFSLGRYSSGGLSSLGGIGSALGSATSVESAVTGAISRTTTAVNGVSKLSSDLGDLGNLL